MTAESRVSNPHFRTPVSEVLYTCDLQESVWGIELAEVTAALTACRPMGVWANLCAGDGRYSDLLLATVDKVYAVDLDPNALARLIQRATSNHRDKVVPLIQDIVAGLPFCDHSLDGVLLNGSLHLFYPGDVSAVCRGILRVLRPGGVAIVDFWYDIQRVKNDGTLLTYPDEYPYSEAEALQICSESWTPHPFTVCHVQTPPMSVRLGEVSYTYVSRGLILTLFKNQEAKARLFGG